MSVRPECTAAMDFPANDLPEKGCRLMVKGFLRQCKEGSESGYDMKASPPETREQYGEELEVMCRKFQRAAKMVSKLVALRQRITCSAVQESSTPTGMVFLGLIVDDIYDGHELVAAAETKETKEVKTEAAKEEEDEEKESAPTKPKAPTKAPAKPLPQLMEEEVIPSLKAILEAQDDISELELSFQDNRLEGYFLKKDYPYSFWAFFPDGVLTGPKGFSLSSYGSVVSTVEPFLVDEKKITAKHVVFWVEKRLAAQGIIPVWKEE
ncbi:unnamed protein product [Camellia sinensis]